MSVKVAFQSSGEPTSGEPTTGERKLMVPKSALRQRDGRDIVWMVRNGRVERRAVTVGPTRGDDVVIAAGIDRGERVVVEGPENLAEGMRATEAVR